MMVGVSSRSAGGHVTLGRGLTHVDHLLETLGADTVQAAQQFGLPATGVVAVVADLALQLLQGVDQRLSPRLHINAPQVTERLSAAL